MSRSSNERISEEEKLGVFISEKIRDKFGAFLTDEETDFIFELCDWYADEKAKLTPEGDKYMFCSKCSMKYDWNGADIGKLTRVRGEGMVCSECMKDYFPVSKEGVIK